MRRGDIYFLDLEPTMGREQRGHRPVLIVTPERFNRDTGVPVILPITNGGNFARARGFSVSLTGCKTTGIVRCDQPRAVELSLRQPRWIETVPESLMQEVLFKVSRLFG